MTGFLEFDAAQSRAAPALLFLSLSAAVASTNYVLLSLVEALSKPIPWLGMRSPPLQEVGRLTPVSPSRRIPRRLCSHHSSVDQPLEPFESRFDLSKSTDILTPQVQEDGAKRLPEVLSFRTVPLRIAVVGGKRWHIITTGKRHTASESKPKDEDNLNG